MKLNPTLVPAFWVRGPREQTHTTETGKPSGGQVGGVEWGHWDEILKEDFQDGGGER